VIGESSACLASSVLLMRSDSRTVLRLFLAIVQARTLRVTNTAIDIDLFTRHVFMYLVC
jgi:hypothetical protein